MKAHNRLKGLILSKGLTQADMANLLAIDPSTFNLKVNGKRDFTITEIEKIKEILCLKYEEIFFDSDIHETKIAG